MKIKLKKPLISYLCIHGHFYQPPRENPWIDVIENQISAYPFHNWNERITYECYLPNCYSKVVDNEGKIFHIVNNFEFINFNIGPTLFAYFEKNFPEVYKKIIEADKRSRDNNNGFGNAIAQVYNHIILPLAKKRDKITQIKWGLEEFEYRFRRKAESIWLSETAIDNETVDLLINFGLKYIILSPTQAARYRKIGTKEWQSANEKPIPTHRAYRIFKKDETGEKIKEKYIDVFFYNGKIASEISFGNILSNAEWLANEIINNINKEAGPTQIISIATDGEVYGHHRKFADMCLASLIKHYAPEKGLKMVNFSNYLYMYPPEWEVELSPGPEGLGTSWSCAHGVARWYRDCGCNTGGQPGWNQKWRTPIREAFDKLNESVAELFEFEGKKYFKNIWQARDDYIKLILDSSPENKQKFLDEHLHSQHLLKEKSNALRLLEIQKYAQFMFTSCGWFFSELSGIEVLQNLKYAAKVITLASHFDEFILSIDFYELLEKAKSNVNPEITGRKLYQEIFKSSLYNEYNIINEFAHKCLFLKFVKEDDLYKYKLEILESKLQTFNSNKHLLCKIRLIKKSIEEEKYFLVYLIYETINKSECYIMEVMKEFKFEKCPQIMKWLNNPENNQDLIHIFPKKKFSISDILFDTRLKLAKIIFAERNKELEKIYKQIYDENQDFINFSRSLNLQLPQELKIITESVLKNQIKSLLLEFQKTNDYKLLTEIYNLVSNILYSNLNIESESLKIIFQSTIHQNLIEYIKDDINNEVLNKILQILLDITNILKIGLNFIEINDTIAEKIDEIYNKLHQNEFDDQKLEVWKIYIDLFHKFNFNVDKLKKLIKEKSNNNQ
ncbi:MAG TPA: DUF3536 domain-containing protein [bacterium]|nr:DUF3536 domain-containing protein [bacterium]HOL47890.1 DUF3536 domain-containing protein [bacterium]HPQ19672.1 DUF3536 domain-containing protein [bacterium]